LVLFKVKRKIPEAFVRTCKVSATNQKRNMNAADSSEKLESHENGTSRKRIREIDADGSKNGNTAGPGAYKSAPGNLKSTKGKNLL
jgi:hypothetical protein